LPAGRAGSPAAALGRATPRERAAWGTGYATAPGASSCQATASASGQPCRASAAGAKPATAVQRQLKGEAPLPAISAIKDAAAAALVRPAAGAVPAAITSASVAPALTAVAAPTGSAPGAAAAAAAAAAGGSTAAVPAITAGAVFPSAAARATPGMLAAKAAEVQGELPHALRVRVQQ
jgi:hypothetical protein